MRLSILDVFFTDQGRRLAQGVETQTVIPCVLRLSNEISVLTEGKAEITPLECETRTVKWPRVV